MGRSSCCDKPGLKKGPWTPEEDHKLLAYIQQHGHGSWRLLPSKAGLERCGKSCRLRWTNYLRPDIKRGKFSSQEEQAIVQLHALLGNRWSAIATHLPKRTDNEIKNYWNTHLKKKLIKMGIDPITHKPIKNKEETDSNANNNNVSALSHMAQWETARLEAEQRLARQSNLQPISSSSHNPPGDADCATTISNTPPSWVAGVTNNGKESERSQEYKEATGKCIHLAGEEDVADDPPSSESGGADNKDYCWDTILGEVMRF